MAGTRPAMTENLVLHLAAMRVLAIDTALEACSVAVLDTAHGGCRACMNLLPMQRGHAEALMPLIARVLAARAARLRRS